MHQKWRATLFYEVHPTQRVRTSKVRFLFLRPSINSATRSRQQKSTIQYWYWPAKSVCVGVKLVNCYNPQRHYSTKVIFSWGGYAMQNAGRLMGCRPPPPPPPFGVDPIICIMQQQLSAVQGSKQKPKREWDTVIVSINRILYVMRCVVVAD